MAGHACTVLHISAVEETAGRNWDNMPHGSISPLAKVHLLTCYICTNAGEYIIYILFTSQDMWLQYHLREVNAVDIIHAIHLSIVSSK